MERTTARSFFQIPFLKRTSIQNQKGFSLLELLIVMMIIGILLTIASISYLNVQQKSRDGRRKADLEQVRSALETYRAQYGYYPDTGGGGWTDLAGLVNELVNSPNNYIAQLPVDPKITYVYRYQAMNVVPGTPNRYYGYCLSSTLEILVASNTCGIALFDLNYKYGVRQP